MPCKKTPFKMRVISTQFLLLVLVFSGCKEVSTVNTTIIEFDNSVKNFTKEIPLNKNGSPSVFYTLTKTKQVQLGFDNLENGYAGLQIRIWYDDGYVDRQKVIIISYKEANWEAKVYKTRLSLNDTNKHAVLTSFSKLTPKSGWKNLAERLINFQILTLPDGDEIENCGGGGGDGNTYIVEIATKKHYRHYSYWQPEEYSDSCEQAKKMHNILMLLKNEFIL